MTLRRRAALLGILAAAGLPRLASSKAAADAAADAQSAWRDGRYQDAVQIWQSLAAKGDPEASLQLGQIYDFGNGVPRDAEEALRNYLVAAHAGLPDAEFNAAAMYDNGVGTPRDSERAALWYARAAVHGHARACYDLGQLYEAGDGVPRNPVMAASWYRMAGADGIAPATSRAVDLMRGQPQTVSARNAAGLVPAVLSTPVDDTLAPPQAGAPVAELVWLAPSQPVPVRYFVQVLGLDATPARDLYAGFTDCSAVLAPLPAGGGRYAWRVYTTAHGLPSYAASSWGRFSA